jgi:hypothetical protein
LLFCRFSILPFVARFAMKIPALLPTLVIADDAQLAAQISCALARPGAYLPILDGPRLTRLDRDAEVVRRNNAAGRAKPDIILLAGSSDDARDAITNRFTPRLRSKIKLAPCSHIPGEGGLSATGASQEARVTPPLSPLRKRREGADGAQA